MGHDIISKCNLHYNLNSHDFYHIKHITLQFSLKPRSTFTAPHQHHIHIRSQTPHYISSDLEHSCRPHTRTDCVCVWIRASFPTHIFVRCMEVIYGFLVPWGERVQPLLFEEHKQACLPGASSHDIIAAQECSQPESSERKSSFHLALTLSLSHSIPISFWKELSIIYPLALTREEFAHFLCVFYVHLIPFFCFFLSQIFTSIDMLLVVLAKAGIDVT